MFTDFRKKSGLSQSQLAKKLNVSQQSISQWENGTREPSIEMLKKLAEIFGCTIDELVR